ncbi:copper-binding protein [Ligilactobacillus pabuli]|uniref:Copper-binding protein n=1 Tax=Ligilactobacillus pabuli TaxID=2886039 RepID=A0ABQ5JIS8_9LACO|nr:cupredoxin domain-containing protein [Ligilactobacillus pabuli]GKS81648.1 copper-binding protein [Ligilactobacillus pabuli]HIW88934.1 cupredoxin domain-containing protein [Candidatus Ligilactobacillus excrementipullorum]
MSEKQVQAVNVTVAGGYDPAVVTLKQGVPAQLTFTRTNDKGCLDVVHSKEMGFEEELPLNQPKTVTVPTDQAGEFQYSCGMDMFFGKVVVE